MPACFSLWREVEPRDPHTFIIHQNGCHSGWSVHAGLLPISVLKQISGALDSRLKFAIADETALIFQSEPGRDLLRLTFQ